MTQQPRTPTTSIGEWRHRRTPDVGEDGHPFCLYCSTVARTEPWPCDAESERTARADLLAQIEKAEAECEVCNGTWWLRADDPAESDSTCYSPLHKALAAIRSAAPVEPTPTYRVVETLQSRDKPPSDILRRSAAPVEPT